MALERYNQKRDFKKTAEPKGIVAPHHKQLIFVIQKHNASHLHYDFRLEMDGVLKSWAVPKGPSLDPSVKRLAMQVEDHPYNYKDFEGSIPKGEYGGGDVIVWDNGTYTAVDENDGEKELLEGLRKGRLSFIMHGKKLKGEFSLVQMKGRGENQWLLMKKDDDYATTDDVLKKNKSVISGYTVENVSESGVIYGQNKRSKTQDSRRKTVARKTASGKSSAKKSSASAKKSSAATKTKSATSVSPRESTVKTSKKKVRSRT